jgi:tRNA(Arg) A34 adenosine deaminase TadA
MIRRIVLSRLLVIVALATASCGPTATAAESSPAQREIDEIYSLLAMAIVYKDWQTYTVRGHNIGALLVDPSDEPVFWARNARFVTGNGTEHGEVRLIRHYLDCPHSVEYLGEQSPERYAGARPGHGFTLYTTLDPCVMCAGMMLMTQLSRAVYVQSDPDYGQVAARLAAGSGGEGALPPYPVTLDIRQAEMPEARMLDESYANFGRKDAIIPYLRSEPARRIFAGATQRLLDFRSAHGNQAVVETARRYLDTVVDSDYQPDPSRECPGGG